MPQPFNYSLNMKDPMQSVMQSLQVVNAMDAMRQQEAEKQAALAEQQAYEADFAAMGERPTTQQIAQLMLKHQKMGAGLKSYYDAQSEQEKQANVGIATRLYAALDSGNTEAAKQLITKETERYRASGMEEQANMLDLVGKDIDKSPEKSRRISGQYLSVVLGPEKFAETFGKLQSDRRAEELHASAKTEAESKANKAAIDSKYAESQAVADLEKKGWDIWKMQKDVEVQKENSRIAAMNAAASKETNELKKRELNQKIDDAKLARDEKIRSKTAELSSINSGIDNSLSTIDRLVNNPALDSVLGSIQGRDYYPSSLVQTLMPGGDGEQASNAVADIETVRSQTFINTLLDVKDRGATFGSLTEREGEKLVNMVQSLKTTQGEKQFKDNVKEIQRLLLKARSTIAEKYGVPQSVPDTPNAQPSPTEIDELLKKYGAE